MKAHYEVMFKKSMLNTSSQWNHVQHEQRPVSLFHDCAQ